MATVRVKHPAKPVRVGSLRGREVWAKWDADLEVYELFASEECRDYLGMTADGIEEARTAATDWLQEQKGA